MAKSQQELTDGNLTSLMNEARRNPVNLRSVLLGLVGVCFICGLTPFNDYVVGNTYMVGNFLPVGLLLFFLVFVLLINAPLRHFAPRQSLSTAELSVTMGMVLVSCALPSSGLMRYLPAFLVGFYVKAGEGGDALNIMQHLHLPDWMFPTFAESGIRERASEPVIQYYFTRIPIGADSETWNTMLHAWLTPALMWGLFLVAMFGAVICMMVMVRRQWVENERLPFPLATVYLSLIEQPRDRHILNPLFRAKSFWIAAGIVFFIHGLNALNQYNAQIFPELPIRYNLSAVLANAPWVYTSGPFKSAAIFFSIVGITYFLQSKVAFSLWATFVIWQVVLMITGSRQVDITGSMRDDQLYGAIVPFAIAILWVGRHHWMMILRQMIRGPRGNESPGRYLPYFVAGWGFVACVVGMILWLVAAGVTFLGAVVIIFGVLLVFLITSRVVAETGLIFVQIPAQVYRPWVFAADTMGVRTTFQNYFFGTMFQGLFVHDAREALAPFTIHALKVADSAAYENTPGWRKAIPFTFALILALGVGYIVSGYSTLRTEYAYAATMEARPQDPINPYGVDGMIPYQVTNPSRVYLNESSHAATQNHWLHFGIGAGITTLLSVLRLRFISWPFHPVGYLLVYTYPMGAVWFSIFIGWITKVLILRFGGSDLFRKAKFFFIGLIIGETGAAAFWLLVSLARVMLGLDYHAIRLLPG